MHKGVICQFPVRWIIIVIVANPPESKLAKRTSVLPVGTLFLAAGRMGLSALGIMCPFIRDLACLGMVCRGVDLDN